jgi:hypothetical protein
MDYIGKKMRLKNFISESVNISWKNKEDLEILRNECSEIITWYKLTNEVFYRGMKKPYPQDEMVKIIPRSDRIPKDTQQELHDVADMILKEKFGWKPRSEGVFATSSYVEAHAYSNKNPHIIFPVDGFKYIWSPKITDAYTNIFQKMEDEGYYADEWKEEYGPESDNGVWVKDGESIDNIEDLEDFDSFDIIDDDYGFGKMYADVYFENFDTGKRWKERWDWKGNVDYYEYVSQQSLEKKLKTYTNKDIKKCLYVGNEIMIKCKYYYAIPTKRKIEFKEIGL